MKVLGGIAAGSPDHDRLSLFLPFQDRTGTYAESSTDLGGHGDLTLRGEL
jgi:hypothetical protein